MDVPLVGDVEADLHERTLQLAVEGGPAAVEYYTIVGIEIEFDIQSVRNRPIPSLLGISL